MDDWEGSYTSGGGVKEPTPKHSGLKMQFSLLAVAILGVGAVASVSLSQQQQDQRSQASGYNNYDSNNNYDNDYDSNYNNNDYNRTPTPYPTSPVVTSNSYGGYNCWFWRCTSPTPTKTPTPTPTRIPTPTPTRVPTPIQQLPTSFPTPTPTPVIPTISFGPTATPVPGATNLSVTLALHGIGKGGDSVNPVSEGNMSPLHSQRQVSVEMYNNQNQLVETKTGNVNYNASSGLFDGTISLGSSFQSGVYTVKVKTGKYLRVVVPGIQTVNVGQTAYLPPVAMVLGDINGDNSINIVDYNTLMGCYSDLLEATDCAQGNAVLADLTDDGHVNQFDYNLFLRELSSREGQ